MTEQNRDPFEGQREAGGRFGKGNKGGPGRQKPGPLGRAVSEDDAERLWRIELELAETDAEARRFILTNRTGRPYQAAPDIPPIQWPTIASVADLAGMVHAVLGAQSAGQLDGSSFGWLLDRIESLARIFERVELAPQVRALQEQLAALKQAPQ